VPQQVHEIIEGVCDTIAAEIQRSLDFFMATSGENEIHHIFVTGGTANLTTLRTAIQRRAKTTVEFFNPVERLTIETRTVPEALLRERHAQLAVSVGLSLRKDKEKRA